jgi:hypothetical protein
MNRLIWPVVFAIVGALVYAFAGPPDKGAKLGELGLKTFFAGMLVLAYVLAAHVLTFP